MGTDPTGERGSSARGGTLSRWFAGLNNKRLFRNWQIIGAIALLLLAASGAVVAGRAPVEGEVDRLKAELDSTTEGASATADEMQSVISDLESQLSVANADVAEAESEADLAYEVALDQVNAELAGRAEKLDQRERELDKQEREVRSREEAVGIAERTIERNSFGDGRYKVGVDIKAGTYRAPGASGCYWAKLATSDGNDIMSNHFGSGPQTLVIDSPWFESSGCGTWVPA